MRRILFYGDSNTYGYDPRGFGGGRYPASVRWPDRLKELAGDGWEILVNAMNGRQIPQEAAIPQVLELIRIAAADQETLWFAVMLGTNDLFYISSDNASLGTAQRMDVFLKEVRKAFPDLPILLIAPPKIGRQESRDPMERRYFQESRQLARYYQLLALQHKISFVSAWAWDLLISYDGVHLTEEANLLFAEKMEQVLAELAEEA
ncbi:MAG: hypothetical protein J6N77_00425 [Lachnospiraceae bacterium]|nr:hypothetical protein [Lachnospiraceae bacterium]